VVAAGLYLGYRSSRILASDARVLAGGVWQMVTFLLNGFAFLLVGLQLPAILSNLSDRPPGELLFLALLVSLTVIVARFVWVFPATYLPRWLVPSIARDDPAPRVGAVIVIAWAGMRGAVSLAAALSLPATFPQRDLLLFLTFAVIIATLVGQGLTLPLLLRRLGLSDGGVEEREEVAARSAANEAALAQLAVLRQRSTDHLPLIENLEQRFRHQAEHFTPNGEGELESDQERVEHLAIMRSVLEAQREAIIRLRDQGVVNDDVMRRVERELDLEELRIEAEA
jgi:monovalent cation/hydrogen antiporter